MSGFIYIIRAVGFGLFSVLFMGAFLMSLLVTHDIVKLVAARKRILATYEDSRQGNAAWWGDFRMAVAILTVCLVLGALFFTLAAFIGSPFSMG